MLFKSVAGPQDWTQFVSSSKACMISNIKRNISGSLFCTTNNKYLISEDLFWFILHSDM